MQMIEIIYLFDEFIYNNILIIQIIHLSSPLASFPHSISPFSSRFPHLRLYIYLLLLSNLATHLPHSTSLPTAMHLLIHHRHMLDPLVKSLQKLFIHEIRPKHVCHVLVIHLDQPQQSCVVLIQCAVKLVVVL